MPFTDYLIMMGVGGLFVIVGLILAMWGRAKEKSYDASLAGEHDLRGYVEGKWRPYYEAVKIGGWIGFIIGILLLVLGIIFWFVD